MHREFTGIKLSDFIKVFVSLIVSSSFIYFVSLLIATIALANVYAVGKPLVGMSIISAYYTIGMLVSIAVFNMVRFPSNSIEYFLTAFKPRRLYNGILCTAVISTLIVAFIDTPVLIVLLYFLLKTLSVKFVLIGIILAIVASITVISAQALSSNPPTATVLILIMLLPLLLRIIRTPSLGTVVIYTTIILVVLALILLFIAEELASEERIKKTLLRIALRTAF